MASAQIDGVELFYREAGSGAPLLLIHGMGGDADVWGPAFEGLADHHRVIAYDRRGFTRSRHAPTASFERHRRDAASLLGRLDAAPAKVVGWSSGGIVALDLAVHNPELVSALVLAEAPVHARRRPGIRQLRAALASELLSRRKDDRVATERFLRWAFRYRTGGTGFDRLPQSMRDSMLANGPASLADLRAGTGEHLTKASLAAIDCPVLCILGELSDRAFSRATRYLLGLIEGADLYRIEAAGHAAHLERPPEFVAAVAGLT